MFFFFTDGSIVQCFDRFSVVYLGKYTHSYIHKFIYIYPMLVINFLFSLLLRPIIELFSVTFFFCFTEACIFRSFYLLCFDVFLGIYTNAYINLYILYMSNVANVFIFVFLFRFFFRVVNTFREIFKGTTSLAGVTFLFTDRL